MKFFTVTLLVFATVLALTSAQGCSGGTQCTGGCCPDANAVCCPSGNACCPHATKCDEAQGLCIPGSPKAIRNAFMMKITA
ncbi:hypothetical protein L596_010870 [Steinernema carpocapsae]|uniref:Granulins domain-containing protein n=1 Tax=Steinernema carpocapsae TaxID=34508 RepID=A0A4U5PKN0_STECR|nr:hypothetical protein L596_010870 [Steinernema carpocapsae]